MLMHAAVPVVEVEDDRLRWKLSTTEHVIFECRCGDDGAPILAKSRHLGPKDVGRNVGGRILRVSDPVIQQDRYGHVLFDCRQRRYRQDCK
jgi:hypothetical protein